MSTAAPQLGSRSASTSSLHALAAVPTSRTAAQLESSSAHELGAIEFGTDKEGRATLVGGGSSSMDDVPLDDAFELFGAQQGEQQSAAMPPELDDWAFLERTPSPVPSAALAALDADQRATVDGAQDVLFTAHGGAEREREQDESLAHVIEDGAGLLRQFTSAFSPSSKGASSTLSGRVEGGGAARALRGSADAEEDSVALRVGGRTDETSPRTRARPPQLASSQSVTPVRPSAPTRSVSIGSGLSSLHLDHPLLSPFDFAATAVGLPVLPPTPTSALAQNLLRILAHPERLPLGLFALLEACVHEADASGCGSTGDGGSTFGSRSMSNLAVRAGLVPPPAGGNELEMPPPARSMRHARSLSASTMASSHSRGASSSSLASRSSCTVANSTSTCSTTLTSSTTSTTPSGSSLETLLLPTPAWTFDADQLPPLPARCHPPNPNANLRFVYEQVDGPYEDAPRQPPAQSEGARRPSLAVPPPLVAASRRPVQGAHAVDRAKRRMARVDEERLGDVVEPDSPLDGPCATSSASSSRASSSSRTSTASRRGRAQVSAAAAAPKEAAVGVQEAAAGPRRSKRAKQGAR